MWLIIDDEKTLGCDVVARTPKAARKELLLAAGKFSCVCFDHDLAAVSPLTGEEVTGHDILKWALGLNLLPNSIQLVTNNPVGRAAMGATLKKAGYGSIDGYNYLK